MCAMIKITINGIDQSYPNPLNVAELLNELGLVGGRIAVEKNKEIIPRSTFDSEMVNAGDRLEIIHFIGGG